MSNTVEIATPNIATLISTYGSTGIIRLQSASSRTGSYSNLTTISLATGDTHYEYTDSSGTASTWYRYRFENAGGSLSSDYSEAFPGRAPVTRTLQQIRQKVAKEMGMYDSGTFTTASSSSSCADSTKVSTLLSTDAYRAGWIYSSSGATNGETTRVGAFTPASGTYTFTPALSATPTASSTYEYYRDLSPTDLNESINDALKRLFYQDSFRFSSEVNRTAYPLPYWAKRGSDARGMERLVSWGATTGEGENEIWEPMLESQWNIEENSGELLLRFDSARGDNEVFRLWILRAYVTGPDDELTSDSSTTFAPLEDLLIGAQVQAYERLRRRVMPNQASAAWNERYGELKRQWGGVLLNQHFQRSVPVRGKAKEVYF